MGEASEKDSTNMFSRNSLGSLTLYLLENTVIPFSAGLTFISKNFLSKNSAVMGNGLLREKWDISCVCMRLLGLSRHIYLPL